MCTHCINLNALNSMQTQRLSPAFMPSFDLFPSDPDMSTVPTIPAVPRVPEKSFDVVTDDPDCSIISGFPSFPNKSLLPSYSEKSSRAVCRSGSDANWLLLGEAEIQGFSTCKGPKLRVGDSLQFSFPKAVAVVEARKGPWGRGKGAAAAAEIVRFSCQRSGEEVSLFFLAGDFITPFVSLKVKIITVVAVVLLGTSYQERKKCILLLRMLTLFLLEKSGRSYSRRLGSFLDTLSQLRPG